MIASSAVLTPSLEVGFARIRTVHGSRSLERVERMLAPGSPRHALQWGAKYVMPGLVSRPWRDVADSAPIARLAAVLHDSHRAIKDEITNAVRGNARELMPYEHYEGVQPRWKALYLFRDGKAVEEATAVVPATARILREEMSSLLCPLLEMHFSILEPGGHVTPHCDLWNFTLNLHFAVDIPEGCAIRVADETRTWVEGECLLFDYTFEHEAWNRGARDRICLLVDVWNPELTPAERDAVVLLVTELRRLVAG